MDNIIVREMMQNEVSTVQKIGRRAFTGLESLWVGKPKQALVAVKGDNIIGAILYKFIRIGDKKIGYVDYAFIDPNYHNQGVGNILYKNTVDYLWKQGCNALTAVVKDDNVGSWGLFLKNGFHRVSLPELIREFGSIGALKQYFGTPFCFGIGMEYYVATGKERSPSSKGGNIKQIISFIVANSLALLPAVLIGAKGKHFLFFWIAFFLLLLFGVAFELIGTKFSAHRNWKFRLNNGGGLVCVLINLTAALPMIGNWYPEKYEKSKNFHRDMGITALAGWVSLLAFVGVFAFSGIDHILVRCAWQIGTYLLFYRMIPFYPFESFGGRRVYNWNKWIYVIMTAATLAVIVFVFIP